MRDRLPTVPIPLLPGDEDVTLALQETFTAVYDRASYELSLNYDAALQPPLSEADAGWMQRLLRQSSDERD